MNTFRWVFNREDVMALLIHWIMPKIKNALTRKSIRLLKEIINKIFLTISDIKDGVRIWIDAKAQMTLIGSEMVSFVFQCKRIF